MKEIREMTVMGTLSLFLTNFGYWYKEKQVYNSLKEAIEAAKCIGFEVSIYTDRGSLIATYSPVGSYRGGL